MKSQDKSHKGNATPNFDVKTYQFEDLDLKIAVSRLPQKDQRILILYLMGHKQDDIASLLGLNRATISWRLGRIYDSLARVLKDK